jgi:hypothetical protein
MAHQRASACPLSRSWWNLSSDLNRTVIPHSPFADADRELIALAFRTDALHHGARLPLRAPVFPVHG